MRICRLTVDQRQGVVKIVIIEKASPRDYTAQSRALEKKLSGTKYFINLIRKGSS